MTAMKQGRLLLAGIAAVAVLAGCSGRGWSVADITPAAPASVAPVSDSTAAMNALASGRFAEAAARNAALLANNPDNRQAQLGYALAQLGLGQPDQAVARLRALAAADGTPDADVGLALALAGQPQEGIAILEEAAGRPDANQRVRQNLALALALADSWSQSRTLIEREAGQARAIRQLTQWAVWAALPPQDRLASFLGVVPVRDATLLAQHSEPPLFLAAGRPSPQPDVMIAQAGGAAETPQAPVMALASVETSADAPEAAPAQADLPLVRNASPTAHGWVVQLAAVRHAEHLEAGWSSLQSRHPSLLSHYTPRMTQGQGWNRLTVGDFSGRDEAMAECQALRRRGIDCFARKADA